MGNYFQPDKEISVLLFFHILLQKMKKQVGYVIEKAGCLFLVSDRNCSGDCLVFCLVRSVLKCENVCRKFWMGDVPSRHETPTDNVQGKESHQ